MATPSPTPTNGGKVLLCVSGGIAAYKAAEVLRHLTESGCEVTVVATDAARAFVGEATWAALSGKPVATSLWQSAHDVPHVSLARWADIVAVVPATADALARIAAGRADDMLAAVCLMTKSPVVMFPAMHTEMWEHPTTQEHVNVLRGRGLLVVTPDSGRLTGPDTGVGRLGEPTSIAQIIRQVMTATTSTNALAGAHVVVTAGGTREAVDPVRVISNRSSGIMGYACATAAVAAGANVTVISANSSLPPVAGASTVHVASHQELADALGGLARQADAVVMAAAVSDYAPDAAAEKMSKTGGALDLRLHELPDILADVARGRQGARPVLVGFAAETVDGREQLIQRASAKRAKKGCDVIVANNVSGGAVFGDTDTDLVIIDDDGAIDVGPASKETAATHVIAAVARHLR